MTTHNALLVINAPVSHVTVMEDRAQVVRTARVTLPAGVSALSIDGLAPVLSDKTLTAILTGPGTATVVDIKLVRQRLTCEVALTTTTESAALRERLRGLEREHTALERRAALLVTELDQLGILRGHTLQEITVDVAAGRDGAVDWHDALARLDQHETNLLQRQILLHHDLARSTEYLDDVRRQLAALAAGKLPLRATATLMISTDNAGTYDLRLSYLVPNACWRPAHTAKLIGEDDNKASVEFTSEAWVWQHTGEDWTGVDLRLSTERASLGTEPPPLTADELHLRRKEIGTVISARDQVVEDTGGSGSITDEMPGIDDGGEVRVLRPRGPADVPTDGRPRRFALGSFTTSVDLGLVLMAERVSAVILRSTQINVGNQPLLAGPVDLIRRGGLAGRTSVRFIAPGARFELGWGPDPDLRVQRRHEKQNVKHGLLAIASWPATTHRVRLDLSNLSGHVRQVQIIERVPVSEIDRVHIEHDAVVTTPAAAPDPDGLVRWTVHVPAHNHSEVTLGWTIKRHPEVVGL